MKLYWYIRRKMWEREEHRAVNRVLRETHNSTTVYLHPNERVAPTHVVVPVMQWEARESEPDWSHSHLEGDAR